MFLINVARNPHAFEKRVERRREIRFAELSMETGVPKLQTDDRAMCVETGWLSLGPSVRETGASCYQEQLMVFLQ